VDVGAFEWRTETLRFFALPPCRLVDTRGPAGPTGAPALGANRTRTFPLAGACGVPAGAMAVAANLTAVNPGAAGDLRVYPAGALTPLASVLNFAAARTRANSAQLALGAAGAVTVQCDMPPTSTANAHLALDVYGYWQ
jgi:hypothetical protein